MIKSEFVKEVASRTGLHQTDVSKSLENGFDIISEQLSEGNDVVFSGFGKFTTEARAARLGRDWDGNQVQIPSTIVPKFKPGINLRMAVQPHT